MKYEGVCVAVKDINLSKSFIKIYLSWRYFKTTAEMSPLVDYHYSRTLTGC